MKIVAPLVVLIVAAIGLLRVSVAVSIVASPLDSSSRAISAAVRLANEFGDYAGEPTGGPEQRVRRARELGGSVESREDGMSVVRIPVKDGAGRIGVAEIRIMAGRVVGLRVHDAGTDRESDEIGD